MNLHRLSQVSFKQGLLAAAGTLLLKILIAEILVPPAWAQPVPASDSTGTQVTIDGDVFNIDGGTLSGDRNNLFHSFESFGLEADQVANFLTNPQIVNVLSRVVGGEASLVNGLIQLSGSNANLFLMNPAGVVFGASAQIDVPGSFVVTTGNGIQFEDGWYSASGNNSFADLIGNPTGFGFGAQQAGSVVNAGELSVAAGESVVLLGDSVVNTGEISAPGGQVIVTAVPGEQFVQLSVPGSLLSLGVSPFAVDASQPNSTTISVASLPELLTIGARNNLDLGVTSNSADDTVRLTSSGTDLPGDAGTTIVSGRIDVSGETAGDVGVLGEQVALADAEIRASGNNGGGTVLVGGNYRGEGTVPTARRTSVNLATQIFANAIDRGDGGRVIVWSDEATGFYGNIEARGGLTLGDGGFSEISSPEYLDFDGTVDVGAPNGQMGTILLDPRNITIEDGEGSANSVGVEDLIDNNALSIFQTDFENADIVIDAQTLGSLTGNIELEATNDIQVNSSLNLSGATSVSFAADSDSSGVGDFLVGDGLFLGANDLSISGANVRTGSISSDSSTGGRLRITASGEITTGDLTYDTPDAGIEGVTGGDIELIAGNDVTTGELLVGSGYGDGGSIRITSSGDIVTGRINADGETFSSNSVSNGGQVVLQAVDDIRVESISAEGLDLPANGGTVNLTSREGAIQVLGLIPNTPNSISTAGSNEGSVSIRTTGGFRQPSQPFFVQDPSISVANGRSGTVGSITSGVDTVLPGTYEGLFQFNNLLIDTGGLDEPEIPERPPTDIGGPEPKPPNNDDGGPTVVIDPPNPPEWPPYDINKGSDYEGLNIPSAEVKTRSLSQIKDALVNIEDNTGVKPAIVYVSFVPLEVEEGELIHTRTSAQQETDQLELVVVTADGDPIRRRIHGTNRADIVKTAETLRTEVSDQDLGYKRPGKKLYNWIISPLERDLEALDISNLVFIMDEQLRSVPLAAMYNEETEKFVVEDYSIGLMPSLSLTDLSYTDIREVGILARGSETFPSVPNFRPLPGAATEIEILQALEWEGDFGIDESFTIDNITASRRENPYGIVHLATHADFLEDDYSNSFIQSWNEKIIIDDIRELNFDQPPLELLVLSACNTALGNHEAELGFAGLAAKAGVKSALASLWFVSDQGTLSLISEFYSQLKHGEGASVKAEALRQAQIKMIRGEIGIKNGQLTITDRAFELPPELASSGTSDLSHPYYWAGFTMVGNPW